LEIKQKTYIEVEKDGKLVQLVVDSDLSLGLIFDALMEMKSWVVTRMSDAHKAEEQEAQRMMGDQIEAEKVEAVEVE
jgi:hypothetical protein